MKLTEDEVIEHLEQWLRKMKWQDIKTTKGHARGLDLIAQKNKESLIVEAKGARANPKSHVKKREKFDCGQIKTHFGKAIVKVLEERNKNPNATIAIAHPEDIDIRNCLDKVLPEIKKFSIKLYWVKSSGQVIEE